MRAVKQNTWELKGNTDPRPFNDNAQGRIVLVVERKTAVPTQFTTQITRIDIVGPLQNYYEDYLNNTCVLLVLLHILERSTVS